MATLILPTNALVLNAYATLIGSTPGYAALNEHAAFINANGTTAYKAALNNIFASTTTATLATTLLANLGLTSVFTQAQAEAYLNANASNRVGAMIDLAQLLYSYSGTDANILAAKTTYANSIDGSYAYSIVTTNTTTQALAGAIAAGGQTFTLTTGLDVIAGTSGNDSIIGDFTATASLNAGDQINGGAGTDTLKMYGTYTAANMPVNISNVEILNIANTAAGNIDLTAWTKASTGIATVAFDNASALSANSITTTTGQALSLSTGSAGVGTAGAVTWVGSATDTSLNLTLNGYQGGTGATAQALTITAPLATTQNIASTGAGNKVTTLTLGATTNKLVVTGDKALTVSTNLVSSGGATILKTVDASATTGGVSITLAAATNAAFAFTGGSGSDTIKLADDGLAALTSGAQLDGGAGTGDKIGLMDTALTTAEYSAINAAKGFEILGLNAAITVDASQLTSIKSFSLDTNAAQTIANMASGSTVTVAAAHAAALTTTTAVGVHDLTLAVGKATSTGLAVGGTVTIGQDAVALSSNGNGTGTNTIATLTAKDNSVYTITGSNDLTITAITAATASGSKYDASAFTGKLAITGNAAAFVAGSALGDVIIGGSGADTITVGLNSSLVTGNGGADTFNVAAAVAAAAPGAGAATTANIEITTITDFTKGDILTFAGTAGAFTAAKVDLSAAASLGAALDLLVAGANSDLKWGVYAGNTYIVDDVGAGATVAATDTIVKLVGSLDLSTSTFTGTSLTFA